MPIPMVVHSVLAFTPSSLLHLLLTGFLKLKSRAKEELQSRQVIIFFIIYPFFIIQPFSHLAAINST